MSLLVPPAAPVDFTGLATFAWIALFLLLGMLLRAVFPPFRKYLIPSCIIGGTLGLIAQSSGLIAMTGIGMDLKLSQLIVYHLFCLTWVFVGLRKPEKANSADKASSTTKRILWVLGYAGASTVGAFTAGILATGILSVMGLNSGPEVLGVLVGYGFVAGPGPALSIANVWAMATDFTGLPDFALAGGAMGFAVSIIVGVFLLNIIARKKKINLVACPSEEEQCGFYECSGDLDDAGQQTTSSTSIDVLAWHIGIGLCVYFLTFTLATLLALFVLPPSSALLVWSMLFMFCSLVAIGVRTLMTKLGIDHLLCNGITTRVSNTIVDFMICATFISISIGNISEYVLPFIASCVAVTAFIGGFVWFITRKLKTEGVETFAFFFGLSTGTISTAFVLLRLVDPQGKAKIPLHLALASSLNVPGLLLLPFILNMVYAYGYTPMAMLGLSALSTIGYMTVMWVFRQPQTATAWEPDPDAR